MDIENKKHILMKIMSASCNTIEKLQYLKPKWKKYIDENYVE